MKYLIALSLLLVSCIDSEILQKAEQEYDLICPASFNELQYEQGQCIHDSISKHTGYASCYNTAMTSSSTIYEAYGYIHGDEFRQFTTEIIIDCIKSRATIPMIGEDSFINDTINALQHCDICT